MLCLASSSSPSPLPRPSPADRPGPGIAGVAGGGNVRLSVVPVPSPPLRCSWPRKAKSKFSVPVAVRENQTMATKEDGFDNLPIYKLDPKLAEFKVHFDYRIKRYLDQKQSIEQNEAI